ncbi:hypothetical protein D3C83_37680 [compost metagenome]
MDASDGVDRDGSVKQPVRVENADLARCQARHGARGLLRHEVGLRVHEIQRVDGADLSVELAVASFVEHGLETLAGANAEVVIALGANVGVPRDLFLVDDLLAVVALDPKSLRDDELPLAGRELRGLFFLEPGHRQ